MTTASARQVDPKKLQAMAVQYGNTLSQGLNCAISQVGVRLGLYRGLRDHGPASSEALAKHCGLHERWVREWLRHQACVNHIGYDESTDTFALSPEAVLLFVEEESPVSALGGLDLVLSLFGKVDELPHAFRTGVGRRYDDLGHDCACGLERMRTYHKKNQLVPDVLPLMRDVVPMLHAGANVADVGCGSGPALVALAAAFPKSRFAGYDTSRHALTRAASNVEKGGLTNVTLYDPNDTPLPSRPTYDLVCTFDVVHDVAHPQQLIAAIRAALHDGGAWLCEDINSFPTFAQNLREHRSAALLYGLSLNLCLASGMSEPGGEGLGTLGFNEQVARQMSLAAGFSRFAKLAYENQGFSNFYDIRP